MTTLLIFVALCVGGLQLVAGNTCTSEYSGQTPTHTMCLTDNANANAVTLTQTLKDQIVSRHNEIRGGVTPTATNMQKMKWDDKLEAVAAKWARQCVLGHDSNRDEPSLPGSVGQNAAKGHSSFMAAVNDWYSEIDDWTYNVWTNITGHYIQQIYNGASRIGCGQATCNNVNYYVCNYHLGTRSDLDVYTQGASGSACPNHKDSTGKLCDCTSAALCQNGGSINLATCGCTCTGPYSGDTCGDCTATDSSPYCDQWTQYCGNPLYQQFMNDNCAATCNACGSS